MNERFSLITAPVKKTKMRLLLLNEAQTIRDIHNPSPYPQTGYLEALEGIIINMSMSISSTSDIRRTASVTLYVQNGLTGTNMMNQMWFANSIRAWFGIYDADPSDNPYYVVGEGYRWYLLGGFVMSVNGYTFDAQTQQLQLSLVDMMAGVTAERGSQIGSGVAAYADGVTTIQGAIDRTIQRFSRYYDEKDIVVEDDEGNPYLIPYDIEIGSGSYPIDFLHELVGLYPFYEMFYSRDGVFTVRKIPMDDDEPCVLSREDMESIIISETGSTDLGDIKNVTELWGRELQASRTTAVDPETGETLNVYEVEQDTSVDPPVTRNVLKMYIQAPLETLDSSALYAFKPPAGTNPANLYGSVYAFRWEDGQMVFVDENDEPLFSDERIPIYVENGDGTYEPLPAGTLLDDRLYVLKYLETATEVPPAEEGDEPTVIVDKKFVYQGLLNIHVVWMEFCQEPTEAKLESYKTKYDCQDIGYSVIAGSRFAVDYDVDPLSGQAIGNGEIVQVLQDGDFANITTTELALERASYENWKKTRLKDVIQISCLFVPWLDVGVKIEYKSIMTGETHQYVVQDINVNAQDFTMDLTLQRFYNYYPWLEGPNEENG